MTSATRSSTLHDITESLNEVYNNGRDDTCAVEAARRYGASSRPTWRQVEVRTET